MIHRVWTLLKGRIMPKPAPPVPFSPEALSSVIARQERLNEDAARRLADYERRQREIDDTLARLSAQARILRHSANRARDDRP
jgi:hypothetical protein